MWILYIIVADEVDMIIAIVSIKNDIDVFNKADRHL